MKLYMSCCPSAHLKACGGM